MTEGVEQSVSDAVAGVANEPSEVRAAVGAAAAAAAVPTPTPEQAGALWYILTVGLVIAVLTALGGIIWVVADGNADTSPDVIVTVFSTALAALVALFVKSPIQN